MPPHDPPCNPNETLWLDGKCYPRIDTFRIAQEGDRYKFSLDQVAPELLSALTKSAGDQARVAIKQAGQTLDVTISAVPREDASELLKQLRPDEPHLKLPD